MPQLIKRDLFPLFLLVLLPCLFFAHLFIPSLKVFYPADFLLSDLIHVNLAEKTYLAITLKTNSLPFVTDLLANGFPLFAESQIGALSLVNQFLYRLFSVPVAFNLTYLLGYLVMNVSFYYLALFLTKKPLVSLFAAVSWMFAGIVMQETVHQGVLQAIFLMPLSFLITLKLIKNQKMLFPALLALVTSEQFLFGHYFVSLATNLFILVFILWEIVKNPKTRYSLIAHYFLYLFLFLALILPQFVQSLFYTLSSNRVDPSGRSLSVNTFEWPYFFTLLTPFPFGHFANSSFFQGPLWQSTTTIPWEASLFLGYALLPVFYLVLQKKQPSLGLFGLCLLLAFGLMFGYRGPLRLFYTLPVISSFRIVVRFSIFFTFFLLLWLSKELSTVKIKDKVFFVLIAVQIGGGFIHFYNYYPTVNYDRLVKPPPTASFIKSDAVYEFGTAPIWLKTFEEKGYGAVDTYLNYHNSLYPYLNLMYNVRNCGLFKYSNFNPKRYNSVVALADKEIGLSKKKDELSTEAKNALRLLGCQYLISNTPKNNIKLLGKHGNYRVYKLAEPLPAYAFYSKVSTYIETETVEMELVSHFPPTGKLAVEDFLPDYAKPQKFRLKKTDFEHSRKIFKIQSSEPGYFFLRQLNFPGWEAFVDQRKTQIRTAFALYQFVEVPSGFHEIEFRYSPPSYNLTSTIRVFGYGFILILIGSWLARSRKDKRTYL